MKIKLIGVGGCGGNTLDSICIKDIENVGFALVDNDEKAVSRATIENKLSEQSI